MYRLKILLFIISFFCCVVVNAQQTTLYKYQDLSHLYYERLKDSIKKAWACPIASSKKETQKKYAEIWNNRTAFLVNAINDDSYVHDGEVFDYVKEIVNQIYSSNKDRINDVPFLLIDRSAAVNAYAVGGNIIVVNLGLIRFSKSREELSLAIAHELSHNILNHPENAISQRAEWLTSEEYKKSLTAVLDSKYERLSRLTKVLENFSFSRSRHQRYHEKEADSLAITLLKKSKIPFDAQFFMRLDSADTQYKNDLQRPIIDYFSPYGLTINSSLTQKRSKGLSTRAFNFKDTTQVVDSLKTHPDCKQRFLNTQTFTDHDAAFVAISPAILEKANKMLVWNMFNNQNLTPCLYRILEEKDLGNIDPWYDFMVHNIFLGLFYSDKKLHRFTAIGIMSKEYISDKYYELQTMLEQMPRESLEQYCHSFQDAGFWKEIKPAELELKKFISWLAFTTPASDNEQTRVVSDFVKANPTSMYCDFVKNFTVK